MLVIDEASQVPDHVFKSVCPALAVSGGKLVVLSTPFGRKGWFHDLWHSKEQVRRVRVTAPQCPRIPREHLENELRLHGESWYRQEYLCSFEDLVGSVFNSRSVAAAFQDTPSLFGGGSVHAGDDEGK